MEKSIKLITYNIDGLPEVLDLKDLPRILKPICWIYKLIKKTTLIKINDNKNQCEKISNYLLKNNADVVAVQEDFNYHNELMKFLSHYKDCTNTGKISLSNVSWFPPKFKTDGINLLYKKDKIKINEENIISWNKSNGYISHANDKLTKKGFRFYELNFENINLDLYIIHMDADFYHPQNCPDVKKDIKARQSQFKQLSDFILNRSKYVHNPVIIMGDTNSYNKYEWDIQNLEKFKKNINANLELCCEEIIPNNYEDCDRIFIINNIYSQYKLESIDCYFDKEIKLSDHKPLITVLNIREC